MVEDPALAHREDERQLHVRLRAVACATPDVPHDDSVAGVDEVADRFRGVGVPGLAELLELAHDGLPTYVGPRLRPTLRGPHDDVGVVAAHERHPCPPRSTPRRRLARSPRSPATSPTPTAPRLRGPPRALKRRATQRSSIAQLTTPHSRRRRSRRCLPVVGRMRPTSDHVSRPCQRLRHFTWMSPKLSSDSLTTRRPRRGRDKPILQRSARRA